MAVLKELKEFMMRGNVVDMAVGVIIGGAFGKIVSSFVSDVIMPPIGLLLDGVNFSDLKMTLKNATVDAAGQAVPAVTLNYGVFIQTILDFVIIATVIFFAIKAMNTFRKKQEEAPAEPAEPTKEEALLAEIRDLLKEQKKQ
ncbi:large conductance mechanosensitive channel [Dysgonomonas sp. PH5-45]|uniref:large-conductance mechanosensitive channel protein MscL n=1 Tax=unclassified Dysgonomonas TaxID=2630389 RepID=UPI002474173B|nr:MULTISPECIES: large-conductance mechanosensitive channel protein MscL [unclassified Dysgonomonas]MDH6354980.1 large conductance mechanosensitive channel [Dysgonomonas sp. PH5-45]MDH6387896.1 large conductance mechanosensitive channel [Dysgonomonas sp. PH5-37]